MQMSGSELERLSAIRNCHLTHQAAAVRPGTPGFEHNGIKSSLRSLSESDLHAHMRERERKPAGMHCTTYQRYTNTIGCFGRSKRNHREVTYSIVQDVGKVSVAMLDDEGGESKSVGLDAAVERVLARVDAADATPPFEEGLTGRRAYALDVVRKRVRLRSAAPVEPYVEG